jgi:hypothetical protein
MFCLGRFSSKLSIDLALCLILALLRFSAHISSSTELSFSSSASRGKLTVCLIMWAGDARGLISSGGTPAGGGGG